MKERMKTYQEDAVISREGDRSGKLYKVVSGKVALYLNYGTKEEYLVCILSEHRYFGEVSFLMDVPENYTAVAVTDVLVMEVSREEFENYVRMNAGNAIDIMKELAKMVMVSRRHLDLLIEELNSDLEGASEGDSQILDIKEKLLRFRMTGFEGYEGFLQKM